MIGNVSNMKRLSVIIPVYKVEEYIGRCIQSVIAQDISPDQYEIIVVDDGSPDRSIDVVRGFQKEHDNIRIVTRRNGGLSAARNSGLDAACGTYVWFVDSDDWIKSDCMGKMLETADRERLDVLCFNARIYHGPDNIIEIPSSTDREGEIFTGMDFIVKVNTIPSAWSALYRRDFLIDFGLRFYEGILHEDQEFTPRAYSLARRIAYIPEHIYYYFQRQGSIMKSCCGEKRCRDLMTVADSLYTFAIRNFDRNSEACKALIQKVNFAVTQSLAFYNKSYFPVDEYRKRDFYPLSIDKASGYFKWKCRLINWSLPLYLFLYKKLKA